MKWGPDTVGALVFLVGGLALRFCGIDAEVWAVVIIAVGFLLGTGYADRKKQKGG